MTKHKIKITLRIALQAAILSVEENCRVAWGTMVIVDNPAVRLSTSDNAGVDGLSAGQRGPLLYSLMRASHIVIIVDIL